MRYQSSSRLPFLGNPGTYITAEAEINHNGRLATALEMVGVARQVGADAIKFQYIVADEIAAKDSPYYATFKDVELSESDFRRIFGRATAVGIDCFITVPSVATLEPVLRLSPPILKIGSTNLTNIPLLRAIGKTGLPVLLSTGLGTLGEIEDALTALDATPQRVGLFHCTVLYPAPINVINLKAIQTMRSAFPGYAVGYSDHTEGETAAVAAVALGARMIEKHFTLDRTQPGPDHAFSADPQDFAELVRAIRETESALGDGVKKPSAEEVPALRGARRFLVASRGIARGEPLSSDALTARRIAPERDGLEPALIERIAGWPSPRDYTAGEPLCWSDFGPSERP